MASDAIQVKFEIAPFLRALSKVVRTQLPFATALALTNTAKDAQAYLRSHLGDTFHVRSAWTDKGIRFTKATKSNLEATVGSKDAYMERQEEGGTKAGKSGGMIARPIEPAPQRADITPRSKWPKALLKKKGFFLQRVTSGAVILFHRTSTERYPIEPVFVIVRTVKVPKRWRMHESVKRIVEQRWALNAYDALTKAIKSAK